MQDEDTEELSAPFSAHARGVPLTGSEGFDWGQNAESLVMSLLDISGAALHLLLAQGWLTILQCIITVCATTFYTYLGVFSVEADLNFTIFGFVVLLPLVLTVFSSIGKRDQALRDLADSASPPCVCDCSLKAGAYVDCAGCSEDDAGALQADE